MPGDPELQLGGQQVTTAIGQTNLWRFLQRKQDQRTG
jgi:hypothetical protein